MPGEPLVIRIGPHLRGGEPAVQLIGATEHDGANEFLEGPILGHEPLREVIEQFGMRRAGAVHAEIIRGGDQPAPKEMQPHTVGHHASGQRVLRMREPLGKLQSAALFGIHGNGLCHFGGGEEPTRDGIAELVGFAVAIDFGVANLLCLAHAHGEILRRGRRRTLGREYLAATLGAA